jgi:PAS domain S-box-containing protein
MIILEIIYNLAILVAISIIVSFVDRRLREKIILRQVIQGIIFGTTAIVGMMKPFVLTEGLFFDGRSVVISTCALFYGPVGGSISALIALVYRSFIGGSGVWMGVSVILSSALIGSLFYTIHKDNTFKIKYQHLYAMGIIVHATMVALMMLIPKSFRQETFNTVALTVIIAYPLANVLMGSIIKTQSEITGLLRRISESEAKYRLLVENQTDLVVKVDADGFFTYVSPSYCRLFGKTEKELLGNLFLPLVHEEDQQPTLEAMKKLQQPPHTCYIEQRALTVDGWRWIAWADTAIVSEKGQIRHIIGVGRDVSDLKETILALEESENKFRTVAETANSAIFIIRGEFFIYTNPHFEILTGYNNDELAEKRFFEIVHPDNREMVKERGLARQKGEKIPSRYEFKIIHKSGETKWISFSGSIINYQGKPASMGTAFDITSLRTAISQLEEAQTQLKTQNEELQSLNEELEESLQSIQGLNKDLKASQLRAEESDRLKSAFLANMSHEIRTPMNGIIGFADLLLSPKYAENEKNKFIRLIISNADHLLEIINDIIDLSKIEAGFISLTEERIEIIPYMNEILASFQHKASDKGLTLSFKQPQADFPVFIIADPIRLRQIFNNLINNAIKYTDKGNIDIGAQMSQGFFTFYVRDSGKGIDPGFLRKIFERFYQVSDRHTESRSGTGLGLAISKSLINHMNGNIWAESEPGRGSTFYFTLPVSGIKPTVTETIIHKNMAYTWTGKTILVAEDDATNKILIEAILKSTGARLLFADSGQSVLDCLKQNPGLDLIVMDVRMPGLNGLEATKIIRQTHPQLPILAQTAFAFEHDRQKALASGCNDYISKPFKKIQLLDKIRVLLEQNQAVDKNASK